MGVTELEPLLTKLRMMAQNHRDIGNYEMEQRLLDIVATIVGLERENARLREENERFIIKLNAEHIVRQNVESENARLLELIADVHEALYADKAGMFHKLTLASMEDDMRELGIEVEE